MNTDFKSYTYITYCCVFLVLFRNSLEKIQKIPYLNKNYTIIDYLDFGILKKK